MARIVLKLGGGVVSCKDKICCVNEDLIKQHAKVIAKLHNEGYDIILVHGAGSFGKRPLCSFSSPFSGHIVAKQWHLQEGRQPPETFKDVSSDDCTSQLDAVTRVRNDMIQLNQYVVRALEELNLPTKSFPPHLHFKGTGPEFTGDLDMFKFAGISVTFGDVVGVSGEKEFGVLSGDDLMVRLALELDACRVVFAVKGVDGLLKKAPEIGVRTDLIEIYEKENEEFNGVHNDAIDVTGGIAYKASRALLIAKHGIDVRVVNGDIPERVYLACKGKAVIGTIIK